MACMNALIVFLCFMSSDILFHTCGPLCLMVKVNYILCHITIKLDNLGSGLLLTLPEKYDMS